MHCSSADADKAGPLHIEHVELSLFDTSVASDSDSDAAIVIGNVTQR